MEVGTKFPTVVVDMDGKASLGGESAASPLLVADLSRWRIASRRADVEDDAIVEELRELLVPTAEHVAAVGSFDYAVADIARWLADALTRARGLDQRGDVGTSLLERLVSVVTFWQAMESGTLTLHGQPIRWLSSQHRWGRSTPTRFELLIRYSDRDDEVSPFQDLGNLARLGLSHVVDAWVVDRAFELLYAYPGVTFHVNIEAGSATPDLLARIERVVETERIHTKRTVFEIVETQPLSWMTVARFLAGTERLGFENAIDDLGDGYAGFAAVEYAGVHYVKLDGALMRKACSDVAARTIVAGVVEYAHARDRQVVAEFVDSDEKLRSAALLGCDFAQGHLVGDARPLEHWLGRPQTTIRHEAIAGP